METNSAKGRLSYTEERAVDSVLDETSQRREKEKKILFAALIFCAFFMVVELIGGYIANSLAILTDATHLMTDVGAYALSIYALYAASRGACARYSYGWHRAEVIGTLVSIFSIWVLVVAIVIAAIHRMWTIYECSRIDGNALLAASTLSQARGATSEPSRGFKNDGIGNGTPTHVPQFSGMMLDANNGGGEQFVSRLICEDIDAPIMVIVGVLGMLVNIICASILYFGGSHGHSHFGGAHGHSHGDDDHGHSHGDASGYGSIENNSHSHTSACESGAEEQTRLSGKDSQSLILAGDSKRKRTTRYRRPSFSGLANSHILNQLYGDLSSNSSHTPSEISTRGEAAKRKKANAAKLEQARRERARLRREMRCGHDSGSADEELEANNEEDAEETSGPEGEEGVTINVDDDDASLDDLLVEDDRPSSDNGTIDSEGEPVGGSAEAAMKNEKRKSGFALHAALLHALGDCVQSVGVILAGAFIYLANMAVYGVPSYRFSIYNLADPVCSLMFAIITVNMTRSLLGDLLAILMESTPAGIDYEAVHRSLMSIDGVESVHDLHVWSLAADYIALSVHLVAANPKVALRKAQRICADRFGITHTTIQVDSVEDGADFCADTCRSPTTLM